ncbi:branched-chain amino acid transport system II carrier protein [Ornithinibacillus sp. BX22]|uniref:Branched-chain amino acid transport system carrier protein n=2 Tax=Ornithinibacillus TaxID=484508 RepID=A0A923L5D2_9BACI|nr:MULTISPECIES: branched-chain amino acid transport system II carrier protein [Ornithinibacillus]MBC5636795.1 branched-chain amino acid transport system II carrier protein [Ornithinibacillus hominis]MBS3681361.1 branched-chain amino acid transport system II carrier protein [Ornithinibacillus massiliensis]
MKDKLPNSSYIIIGVMLFALFFGAGNLIFPAQLGQAAGTNMWPAAVGFLLTGVGLPLLGIIAMGFSGSKDLQDLASRVSPIYGVLFTTVLYLTIGPFFAAPRTGAVAFDIAIAPHLENKSSLALFLFTVLFFAISLWFSLNPAKIVDRVGKLLAPGIVVLLAILLIMVIVNPMGNAQAPLESYQSNAFVTGFLEGYNTMDALASLVFGIIVINAIKALGVSSRKEIVSATFKTGFVAIILLGLIYVGIAYLGAVGVEEFGLLDTGGLILSSTAKYYFGTVGTVLLGVVIILACLTTNIGLMTACAEYFQRLIPRVSYKTLVMFFTVITFTIANFGLTNIITYSVPVLMLLYPLAIVLMILVFLSPLFNHSRIVYMSTISITFLISIFDGWKVLQESLGIDGFSLLEPVVSFYEKWLPFYDEGLGWLVPAIIVILITGIITRMRKVAVNL